MPNFNTTTYLAWRHEPAEASTLRLHASEQDMPVPDVVATVLLRDPGRLLGDDPAYDLLLAEQDLRGEVRWLASEVAEAAAEITLAREEITDAEDGSGFTRWWKRRAASAHLADAARTHTVWSRRHEHTVATLAALRAFVVDLDRPDGPLAQAAAGWQRGPARPDYVVVFATEETFLDGDSRRGVAAWSGGKTLGGRDFGLEWRRDPDDEIYDGAPRNPTGNGTSELVRGGVWRLSYLSRTREVYATRWAPGHDAQVWLLGTDFPDEDALVSLLIELEDHMLEPNSLVLAAEQVHRHARAVLGEVREAHLGRGSSVEDR